MPKNAESFERLESTKLIILRILQVLQKYSDENHPLMQEEIIRLMERDYQNTCERKTVKSTIDALRESDFQIEEIKAEKGKGANQRTGVYYDDRQFTDAEIELIIGLVRTCKTLSETYKKNIIVNLADLASPTLRENLNLGALSGGSTVASYNASILSEAIADKKKVKFNFNNYAFNKQLQKTNEYVVSPFRFEVRDQKHYLVAVREIIAADKKRQEICYYRLDHISDICVLPDRAVSVRAADNYEYWQMYEKGEAQRPFLFTDKPDGITLRCIDRKIFDQVVDFFGSKFDVFEADESSCKLHVLASPQAIKFWALQFLDGIEVLAPAELREEIRREIEGAAKRYGAVRP